MPMQVTSITPAGCRGHAARLGGLTGVLPDARVLASCHKLISTKNTKIVSTSRVARASKLSSSASASSVSSAVGVGVAARQVRPAGWTKRVGRPVRDPDIASRTGSGKAQQHGAPTRSPHGAHRQQVHPPRYWQKVQPSRHLRRAQQAPRRGSSGLQGSTARCWGWGWGQ